MARTRAKRLVLSAASGLLAVGGALAVAAPAHASPGDHVCGSDPNTGIVCITEDGGGYNAEFWSAIPGGSDRFELLVDNNTYYDDGSFNVWTDSYNSFYFGGRQNNAAVCFQPDDWQDYSRVCTPIIWG